MVCRVEMAKRGLVGRRVAAVATSPVAGDMELVSRTGLRPLASGGFIRVIGRP